MDVKLSLEISGLRLKNPTLLASGIIGTTYELMKKCIDAGASAVVTKSIGLKARKGFPNPTIVGASCGLINALGLPNPGVNEMIKEIRKLKKDEITVIASIYGFSPLEYVKVAKAVEKAGADAIELNISCPHVKEVGVEIGQNPKVAYKVTSLVKSKVSIPVIVKLTPNVTDIVLVAKAVEKAGADAITAINTLRAMAIDIDLKMPILSAKIGGLSGPAIKPIAVRCVYEISKNVKIPVIGCGGIVDWQDALEMLLAGASAIQIGTGILYKGLRIFKEINDGIANYLKNNNLKSIKDLKSISKNI
ncbi:MAG: dihydroorotate dehydrogenase [Candidatus Bathyarchaeia archaeon]